MKHKKDAWKQMTVRVPPEVHRALKIRAAEEGRTVAVIVEDLVRGYLVGDQGTKAGKSEHDSR